MERVEFKCSILELGLTMSIGLLVCGSLSMLLYHFLKTSAVFVILLFPILAVVKKRKYKLMIENGILHIEKCRKTEEVLLENVAQIVLEETEIINFDGIKSTVQYINLINKMGHSVIKFSTEYFGNMEEEKRFIDTIHTCFPNIKISFESPIAK